MRTVLALLCCCLIACLGSFAYQSQGKDSSTKQAVTLFDANPEHLWNRLHTSFFVRVGPDGKEYGADRLEPLLWLDTQHLSKEESAEPVKKALRELIGSKEDPCFREPLKRAIMQRDLWLVAQWRASFPDAKSSETLGLLAKALRHLALTPDEIAKLPDNYAAALAARKFPSPIDPKNLAAGYLPTDLFDPKGPWLCVGRTDKPTAPMHLMNAGSKLNPFTNSVFFVFVKHAEGRDSGLKFLKQLTELNRPLLLEEIASRGAGLRTPRLNLQAPQLPVGSQLALVRRMLLIDTHHKVVASSVTESVQIREITTQAKPEAVTEEDLVLATTRRADFEVDLSRSALFRSDAGGLRDVSSEHDLLTGFLKSGIDPFQQVGKLGTQELQLRAWRSELSATRRDLCVACHRSATIYGTNNFQRLYGLEQETAEETRRRGPVFPVAVMPLQEIEQKTIRWKEQQPDWLLLKARLAD